jgi:septal ring factor EnvC (AmiA/AmiB activator)
MVVAAVGLFLLGVAAAAAQGLRPGEVPYLNAAPGQAPGGSRDEIKQRDQELEAIRAEQRRATEKEAALKREIEALGEDRRKISAQLIEFAGRVRAVEEEIVKTEERLAPLDAQEQELRQSLDARRSVIAEVLAAMQRIGRSAPPALLARPEDALQSVRSAMLLNAVLPEMRQEAAAVLKDIRELARVRTAISMERANLTRDLASLADDRRRLTLLTEQRQKQQADTEKVLMAERERATQLAQKADNLKDLIAKLEQDLDAANRMARATEQERKVTEAHPNLAALKDPGRLAPAVAFASAKRMLPLPVNGVRIKEFGAPDGVGGAEKGLSIAARPGAQVTAPCDGWVVYAGPFRNYGQLLILNAGGGYHILLAGMERISVDLGQFVVTGEPVAVMGGRTQSAAAAATSSGRPVLYVEFRKDGTPVDPNPWWATSESEKVRG